MHFNTMHDAHAVPLRVEVSQLSDSLASPEVA